ncbi:MAG: hypothetical protein GY817_05290, partial [bacterium]|nr:hypothetical protein [bacterium]
MLNIQRIQYCFINIWNIIIISFGLSLDAFAVSVANGNIAKSKKLFHALKFAISFSFFQMFMPLIGWLMGVRFQKIMGNIDHWIAFT